MENNNNYPTKTNEFSLVRMENETPSPKQDMKKASNSQLRHCINSIKEIKTKYYLSPEQSRYVDKVVREELGLKTINKPKNLPDYLTPAEIHHMRNIALSKKNGIYSMLLTLLISTGLRISEARNLQIDHIDFHNNQIKVIQGKGAKDRYVPIPTQVLSQIKHYISGRDRGYLFINSKWKQYSVRRLQQIIEEMILECGFNKKLSTHSLRHTFACLCLARGMRLEDIKLMMGHSAIKTTEIYAKLELGNIKEKYLQLMGDM
jgi:integrase/recombinase XerD